MNARVLSKETVSLVLFVVSVSMFFIFLHKNEFNKKGSYYPEAPFSLAYSVYKDMSVTHYTTDVIYDNGIQITGNHKRKIPLVEAPAYALFMGLIWKITNTLTVFPVQCIQIVLFALSCVLLYLALTLFFDDKQKALVSVLMVPLFLPLTFLMCNPVRDVFCFYGSALLVYLLAKALYQTLSIYELCAGTVLIAVCQWMRPTVFSALLAVFIFVLCYALFDYKKVASLKKLFLWLWLGNIVFFWSPWMVYNKYMYGRYFVGQGGQLLLDSMGYTGPNKINPNCTDTTRGLYCDGCVTNYTIRRFNIDKDTIKIGSPEMDDKMKEAFWEWFWQDPVFWFKGLVWRIKKVLFLDMTWSFTAGWNWHYYNSFTSYMYRLRAAYSFGWVSLLEFLFRRWHVRVFMLLGYMGALCLFFERRFLFLGVLVFLVAGGICPAILSHPEHRYLTPFYFIYPLCAGYALYKLLCYALCYLRRQGQKKVVA